MSPPAEKKESRLARLVLEKGVVLVVATRYQLPTGENYWQYRKGNQVLVERSKFGPNVLAKMLKRKNTSYSTYVEGSE